MELRKDKCDRRTNSGYINIDVEMKTARGRSPNKPKNVRKSKSVSPKKFRKELIPTGDDSKDAKERF